MTKVFNAEQVRTGGGIIEEDMVVLLQVAMGASVRRQGHVGKRSQTKKRKMNIYIYIV